MIIMETERLIVRNFRIDDWEDLYEYLSQKDVLNYEPESVSDGEDCKNKCIERSKSNIFWAVCIKNNNKMIGHIYFNKTGPTEFLTWELVDIFNPKYYSKGYATEASQRILKWGFEELGAHRIIAMCNPENFASWKLLERLMMRREGYHKKKAFFRKTEDGKPIWHDAYQYAILTEEWNFRTI